MSACAEQHRRSPLESQRFHSLLDLRRETGRPEEFACRRVAHGESGRHRAGSALPATIGGFMVAEKSKCAGPPPSHISRDPREALRAFVRRVGRRTSPDRSTIRSLDGRASVRCADHYRAPARSARQFAYG